MCFFFTDTATTEIYTLSLHDALPISKFHPYEKEKTTSKTSSITSVARSNIRSEGKISPLKFINYCKSMTGRAICARSEEHTFELQSRLHLVCRLLLEKKKKNKKTTKL